MDAADPAAPPPPRLDEFLPGTLVVVFDDPVVAASAAAAVADRSANHPYVLSPDEVIAQDIVRTREAGLISRAYRWLGSILSDQSALQARYVDFARVGRWVLVAVARDETQATDVWHELRLRGAHDGIHVMGRTLRELV